MSTKEFRTFRFFLDVIRALPHNCVFYGRFIAFVDPAEESIAHLKARWPWMAAAFPPGTLLSIDGSMVYKNIGFPAVGLRGDELAAILAEYDWQVEVRGFDPVFP